jgi:hypothetical protein
MHRLFLFQDRVRSRATSPQQQTAHPSRQRFARPQDEVEFGSQGENPTRPHPEEGQQPIQKDGLHTREQVELSLGAIPGKKRRQTALTHTAVS